MENYNIDWGQLTQNEAQDILDCISSLFNVVAKSCDDWNVHDVSYLEVRGSYDDGLHAENL